MLRDEGQVQKFCQFDDTQTRKTDAHQFATTQGFESVLTSSLIWNIQPSGIRCPFLWMPC